ncbi:MAG: hypothetical protein V4673_01915 [Pseudomonadota bacterium]
MTVKNEPSTPSHKEIFLVCDFFKNKQAYLIANNAVGFKSAGEINHPWNDDGFSGFAILRPKFIAIYSADSKKCDDVFVPEFSKSCFLKVHQTVYDLKEVGTVAKWKNGLFFRRFYLEFNGVVVYDCRYFRPWLNELFSSNESNLHRGGDFFSYVIWAQERCKRLT